MYLAAATAIVPQWTVATVGPVRRPRRRRSVAVRAATAIADWSVAWPMQHQWALWQTILLLLVAWSETNARLMHEDLALILGASMVQKQPMPVRRDSAR